VSPRDRFSTWCASALQVPCFRYGPVAGSGGSGEPRTLPEIRRAAFVTLDPDDGSPRPHPTAGATAVGARPSLVAYNLFVAAGDVGLARAVAAAIRGPGVRSLGFDLGGAAQVSCNLTDPFRVGPATVYDQVAARLEAAGAGVARAELVGLVPAAVLRTVPSHRLVELDLDESRTIEARLAESGVWPPAA
jgi:glutamate formiminotransferase / 5-formyltetrahydrofolate cyclo-ligase